MTAPAPDGPSLTTDERAAARAFVARCEVRLSTFHRIAVGMLSGAGLLVVLPVAARDSVSGVLRSLLIDGIGVADVALTIGVVAMMAVPVVALWLLFADLTRFYFHANHLGGDGRDVFTPRFTLAALQLASDELGPAANEQLAASRTDPRTVELLVPTNDRTRRRVDRQLQVYPGLDSGLDDVTRARGLFELAASSSRPLLDEVARVEHSMVRHVLRLRGLVLRYVKALLALLTTALAVYFGDAIVAGLDPGAGMTVAGSIALAAVVLVWAPVLVLAVTSPVRWIENLMRDDRLHHRGSGAGDRTGRPRCVVDRRDRRRVLRTIPEPGQNPVTQRLRGSSGGSHDQIRTDGNSACLAGGPVTRHSRSTTTRCGTVIALTSTNSAATAASLRPVA